MKIRFLMATAALMLFFAMGTACAANLFTGNVKAMELENGDFIASGTRIYNNLNKGTVSDLMRLNMHLVFRTDSGDTEAEQEAAYHETVTVRAKTGQASTIWEITGMGTQAQNGQFYFYLKAHSEHPDADKNCVCDQCGWKGVHKEGNRQPYADSTCLQEGSTEYFTCSKCKGIFADKQMTILIENISDTVIPKKPHSLTIYQPASDATCEDAEKEEFWQCDQCFSRFADSEGKTDFVPGSVTGALGHNFDQTVWNANEDEHWNECLNGCGKKENMGIHTFTIHFVQQQASVNHAGFGYDECGQCGYRKPFEIDALAPLPQTGDDAAPSVWALASFAAACVLFAMYRKARRVG